MFSFFTEYLWTLSILIGFAFAGGFIVIPFRDTFKYTSFAAPLAGILLVALGTSGIYSLFNASLINSATISSICCIILTGLTIFILDLKFSKPNLTLLIFAGLVIAVITYITNYTTIMLGSPGFLFMDGSDHLGYAHLADWVNNHLATERPVINPQLPYQSYPNYLFNFDPRFGSFFFLGIISDLRHLTSMFAYDFACGIVLSASFLAISALFGRSTFAVMFILLGLLTSHWFDYSRGGYLGKLINYPSSFFIISLFLFARRPFTITTLTILAVLTCAATITQSFFATVAFFIVIGTTYIIIETFFIKENKFIWLRDNFLTLALLIGISISVSGIFSRPMVLTHYPPHPELNWTWLLPRIFDLENMGVTLTFLTSSQLTITFISLIIIYLIFLIVGIWKKNSIVIAVIAGPLLFLLCLIFLNAKSEIYQLIGTFYPWFLCASAFLLIDIKNKFWFSGVIVLLTVSIILHVPHMIGAVERYAGPNVNKSLQFSKKELDNLSNNLENTKPLIEIEGVNAALPLLVEIGRHEKIALQWSPEAWKSILAYRSEWTAPKIDTTNHLRIVLNSSANKNCKVILKTIQYQLLEC